jgi:hypothetical protein
MKDTQGTKLRKNRWGASMPETIIYNKINPMHRATTALALLERWGMIAAEIDGEDSAGRTKARLMTPEEMVTRACDTANLVWDEFEKREWLLMLPEPPDEKPEAKQPEQPKE